MAVYTCFACLAYSLIILYGKHYLITETAFFPDDFLKDVFTDVGIYSAQWIIHQVHIRVVVDCPGQSHSVFLSTTQVYSLKLTVAHINTLHNQELIVGINHLSHLFMLKDLDFLSKFKNYEQYLLSNLDLIPSW